MMIRRIVHTFLIALCACGSLFLNGQLIAGEQSPTIRFIRSYGMNDELLAPVVLLGDISIPSIAAYSFATVEFDVQCRTIPNIYARAVHCNADWTEDENSFLSSITDRTSIIEWALAPTRSVYYTYRGKIRLPTPQLMIRFSGNWKLKIFDMDDDVFLGEARFFVVDYKADCSFNFMTDFYEPKAKVSSIALTLEAVISAPSTNLMDQMLHTVTFYRNHRWGEPFVASIRDISAINPYSVETAVNGVFPAGKIFRASRIPAQNEYRILDLTNLAMFPFTGQPIRLPLSDMRRNGSFFYRADDGAMVSLMVPQGEDEYVPIEFILDPQPGQPSEDEVFVVGSFNNWMPDKTWMMFYDEENRFYRLRQWVRRGRHNYMYATGKLDVDNGAIFDVSFEEFEGNTASNTNSYVAFAYYRVLEYGGYDGIVSVGSSNIYKSGR